MAGFKNPIRVAVIGANHEYGWGGTAHMRALSNFEGFEVVAICNSNEESARRNAIHFNVPQAFSNVYELAQADGIDLVSVCMQVSHHVEVVTPLLSSKKAILCEWPLAKTTAEAEALARSARERSACCWVGLQGRFAPAAEEARRFIAAGKIGEITSVRIEQSVPFQERPTRRTAYLQNADSGADFLAIPVAHAIDVMRYCIGFPEQTAAYANTSVPYVTEAESGDRLRRTSPDQLAFVGALANGAPVSALFRGGRGEDSGFLLEVSGTQGGLVLHGPRGGRAQMAPLSLKCRQGMGEYQIVPQPEEECSRNDEFGLAANVHRLYEAIKRSKGGADRRLADFEDAVKLHHIVDALRRPYPSRI